MPPAIAFGTLAACYLLAASRRPRWPVTRTAAFIGGTAAGAIAVSAPAATPAAHVAEHGLMIAVAAPLMVLGAPLALGLSVLAPGARRRALGVLRLRVVVLAGAAPSAWLLFVAVQAVWHLSALAGVAGERPWLHALEHGTLLGAALLFWQPVIGADPSPGRLRGPGASLYLLAAIAAGDLMSAQSISAGRPLAGAVMVLTMLPLALAFLVVTWRWMVREERRALRWEAGDAV